MSKRGNRLYEFGEFRLDAAARCLSRRGVTVPLTPKAVDVLLALVEQSGQLLDKDTLLKAVWPDSFVEENNLADNVFKLRRVLEDGENGPKFIETVPRRGYRFIADVRTLEPPEPGPEPKERVPMEPPSAAHGREDPALVPAMTTGWRGRVPWLVAFAMILLVVALGVRSFNRGWPQRAQMLRASLLPPENATFGDIAVSPDGKWLAFTAATGSRVGLWLQSLATDEASLLEGTDGASHPFWSPDSRSIGFFAGGKLKKLATLDGPPVTLCQAFPATGGTWNGDDVILFTVLGVPQIWRVSASGGRPEAVLRADPGQTDLHEPFFLPDGKHFLYLAINGRRKDTGGIYVGSLDGTLRQRILAHDSNAAFVAGPANDPRHGYLLFGREGGLVAQTFDADTLRISGEPVPIAAELGTVQGANLSYRRRVFTTSASGLLIYDAHPDRLRSELRWVDRNGKPLNVLAQLDNVSIPYLSPDESRIVVARKDLATNNNDLWLMDALGNSPAKFTFDQGSDLLGLWSPDGQRIVWSSTRNGSVDLYEKEVSGAGRDAPLLLSAELKFPLDWSQDGRYLLYRQIGPQTGHDIFVLPMNGERKPFPYLQTPAMENGGTVSPDGRWIAYSSDESSERFEVYIDGFPTHGGKRQISLSGGSGPRWRGDGKELYYHSLDGRLMAVPITGDGSTLTTGPATALFAFRASATMTVPSYAVTRDGQRFLLSAVIETNPKAALSVVQNWPTVFGP